MNELVREIEEDIRRERIDKLWNSFGKVIVGISVLVILATIAVVVYQNHLRSQAMDKTSQLLKGLDRIHIEDFNGAIPIFTKLAGDKGSPYFGIAMLRKAQAEVALGKHEDAFKTYQEIAGSDPLTAPLAQLLRYTYVSNAELLPQPDKSAALYYTHSEFRGWQLLQQGKKEQAVDQFFALLQDSKAPFTMRERLGEVLQHIAPEKLAEKPTEKSGEPSVSKDIKP